MARAPGLREPPQMDGPDLDALFGDDPEPAPSTVPGTADKGPARPHPALVHAVEALYADAWPQTGKDLRFAAPDRPVELCANLAQGLEAAASAASKSDWLTCAQTAEPVRARAWEELFAGTGWKRDAERELYMLAELFLALGASARGDPGTAVSCADNVFVFSASGRFREAALLFVTWLDGEAREQRMASSKLAASFAAAPRWAREGWPSEAKSVARWHNPDRDKLEDLIQRGSEPFVVTGMVDWPARERWASLAYLDGITGHRRVPVEVGSKVGAANWREELMPMWCFLSAYMAPSCEYCSRWLEPGEGYDAGVAYLAQHELLEQCPVLRSDISLPEDWRRVVGKPTRTNVWLGTHGTLTPCHWDSYDNFLVQVQGTKRVVLLPPKEKDKLYVDKAGGTSSQGNVSQVDVESPDLEKFPAFATAKRYALELDPGEALFIPRGWWHQVRSLAPSFSVNFWF